jgi:hypothetical protein
MSAPSELLDAVLMVSTTGFFILLCYLTIDGDLPLIHTNRR